MFRSFRNNLCDCHANLCAVLSSLIKYSRYNSPKRTHVFGISQEFAERSSAHDVEINVSFCCCESGLPIVLTFLFLRSAIVIGVITIIISFNWARPKNQLRK